MKKSVIYIALLGWSFSSCQKISVPDNSALTTSMLYKTSKDLDNLLYGVYGAMASGSTEAGGWKFFPEILADYVDIDVIENIAADPYKQLYDRDMVTAQYPLNWQLAYTAIQNVNVILYVIDNKLITSALDPTFTDLNRDRIRGEALFLRGIAYFELVRLYGQQYGYNSTAANSGVILRIKPVLNATTAADIRGQGRATVEEVYQQVISDLKLAETLITPSNSIDRRGRPNNSSAAAILARVYFQMNDYTNAMVEINKVIGVVPGSITTSYSLFRAVPLLTGNMTLAQASQSVQTAFISSSTGVATSENVFDLLSVANAPINGTIGRKYYRTATVEPHLSLSAAFLTDANFNVNDGRKVTLLPTVGAKTYCLKFNNLGNYNIPVIRSAELVLDRAEINAMIATQGSQAHLDALADLNLIRGRAIGNYISNATNVTVAYDARTATITTIPATMVLAEVQKERIRELAFEGDRLHNLRRMKANINAGSRVGVQPLPYNSNKLLFRIPDAEISTSSNIVQNPN